MTRDEILSLSVGPELDRLVMEKVFNAKRNYHGEEEYWYHYDENGEPDYEWSAYNSPSTDMSAAWEVLEKVRPNCDWYGVDTFRKWYRCLILDNRDRIGEAYADTAPEAICKAALLAVMEGNDEES